MYCVKCGTQFSAKFCPECGEPALAEKFCPECGKSTRQDVCPDCGARIPKTHAEKSGQPVYVGVAPAAPVGTKNKWIAFFLCLFLGLWGAHKFYEGKIGMGVLYIFTFGLFFIGAIVDLIVILCKPDTYYYPDTHGF